MDRRTFLKTSTAAAGSGLAISAAAEASSAGSFNEPAAPALSRGTVELTFATPWSPDVPVLGCAAARLLARLRQVLGDRYRIEPATSAAADLRFGPIPVESDPAYAYFAGLPGSSGLDPSHLQAWLAAGGGQMLWDDLAAQHGSKPLLAGHTGARPGLWASRTLSEAADFAGASIALTGAGRLIAGKIGAGTVDPQPSAVGGSLASGNLAALEWGSPMAGLALGLPDAAAYFYRDGIHPAGIPLALDVRLGIWDRLTVAERVVLEGVAACELALSMAEAVAHERPAEQAMSANAALTVCDFPAGLTAALDRATAEFIGETGSRSPLAARVRDSYLAFHKLLGGSAPDSVSA